MKNIKCYSFFDIIGTKELIKRGEIEGVLNSFYKRTKMFVNENLWRKYGIESYQPCLEENCNCPFHLTADVFSDSMLFEMDSKFSIELLIQASFAFQKYLLENEPIIRTYFIVNKDTEYIVDNNIMKDKVVFSSAKRENFRSFVSPGKAWVNIYLADGEIIKMKDWHKKYNAYLLNSDGTNYSSYSIEDNKSVKYIDGNIINISAIKSIN